MFGGHYTAYACCEDVSYDTPTTSLDRDVLHSNWNDSHVSMREYMTPVHINLLQQQKPTTGKGKSLYSSLYGITISPLSLSLSPSLSLSL